MFHAKSLINNIQGNLRRQPSNIMCRCVDKNKVQDNDTKASHDQTWAADMTI